MVTPKVRTALVMALALSLGSGCILVHDGHGHGYSSHRRVVVVDDCSHDDFCGHYWHGGRWHRSHGHRHGPGCGHHYHEGRWVLKIGW